MEFDRLRRILIEEHLGLQGKANRSHSCQWIENAVKQTNNSHLQSIHTLLFKTINFEMFPWDWEQEEEHYIEIAAAIYSFTPLLMTELGWVIFYMQIVVH